MIGFWVVIGLLALGALAFWHGLKIWAITLIGFNLMFATLLAIGLFEMLANILDGVASIMSYYSDMLCFMLIFILSFAILMFCTKMISKTNLFFEPKTDKIVKWIVSLVVIIGFAGTAGFVFYETMPEKPNSNISVLPTMYAVDLASKGSLKPLLGSTTFDSKDFVQRQYKRNAGVYYKTMKDGTWKFEGDSPNAN